LPPICRTCRDPATDQLRVRTPKNICDFSVFKSPILLKLELKSTAQKSVSLDEKIIKSHQIKGLEKINNYNGIVAGFIFNFRNYDNQTYFVYINDFIKFTKETDRKSIPLDYCKETGIQVENKILRTNYRYDLDKLISKIIPLYS
jgi:penicillin-binding protein-related factor A (putative recombinase)